MFDKIFRYIDSYIGEHKIYYLIDVLLNKVGGVSVYDYFLYKFYEKNRFSRKRYMVKRQSRRFEKNNNASGSTGALVDKYQFNKMFSEFIRRDFLYMKDATLEDFTDFINKHPTFIEKKNWLCEGVGVSKVNLTTKEEVERYFSDNKGDYIIIEEPIIQHSKMVNLHPQSVNTLRVTTLFHDGQAYVVAAALRIGTGENCTDNLHNAGIACAVDVENGIVISKGYDKDMKTHFYHPDTKIQLLGFAVPNWQSVLQTALQAANLIPDLKWIGWDIAVTEDSCVIVEGNTNQATDLIQLGQDGLWPRINEIQRKR